MIPWDGVSDQAMNYELLALFQICKQKIIDIPDNTKKVFSAKLIINDFT